MVMGSGQVTSAPGGFQKGLDPLDPATGLREINFRVNLVNAPNALIFDPIAPSIPSVFTNPRTGTFDFFISTPRGFTLASLPTIRNDPGIDIKTQMAWVSNGAVQAVFPNLDEAWLPEGNWKQSRSRQP